MPKRPQSRPRQAGDRKPAAPPAKNSESKNSWKSGSRSAMIGALTTALLTLGGMCATYFFDTGPARLKSVGVQRLAEVTAAGVVLRARVDYVGLSNAVEKRSVDRIEKLQPFAGEIGRLRELESSQASRELHLLSAPSRLQIEADKERLGVYTPAMTGLSNPVLQIHLKSLDDELAMWSSLDELLERVEHDGSGSRAAHEGWDEWMKHLLAVNGDNAGIEQADAAALARVPAERQHLAEQESEALEEIALLTRHLALAGLGLAFSLIGLSAIVVAVFDLHVLFLNRMRGVHI